MQSMSTRRWTTLRNFLPTRAQPLDIDPDAICQMTRISVPGDSYAARVVLLEPTLRSDAEPVVATNPMVTLLATVATDDVSLSCIAKLAPDVVVLDLRESHRFDVGALVRRVQLASSCTPLIVMCREGDEVTTQLALMGGATACLAGDTDPFSVLRAITDVARGRMFLSPVGRLAIHRLLESAPAESVRSESVRA